MKSWKLVSGNVFSILIICVWLACWPCLNVLCLNQPIVSICIYWLVNLAVSGRDNTTSSCLQAFCLKKHSHSHTGLSIEKLTREEQLSFLMSEKMNAGRTRILRDWVIDRWGAVVLPHDWAIDSGRGFALGFDWPRRSGSSWEVSLQTDKSRCQLSTQLQSPSFLSVLYMYVRLCAHVMVSQLTGALQQCNKASNQRDNQGYSSVSSKTIHTTVWKMTHNWLKL